MRSASYAVCSPGLRTASTRWAVRSSTVRGRASVTLRQCSGWATRWSRESRGRAEDRQQPVALGPSGGAARRRARARRRRGPSRRHAAAARRPATASMSRTRLSSARSGSAVSPRASGRPSLKVSSSGSTRPAERRVLEQLLGPGAVGEPEAGEGSRAGALAGACHGTNLTGGGRRAGAASESGQVPLELELGDLAPVVVPLGTLVAQEEVEDVLAEGVGHEIAASP